MRRETVKFGRQFTGTDPVVTVTAIRQGPAASLVYRLASTSQIAWAFVQIVGPAVLGIGHKFFVPSNEIIFGTQNPQVVRVRCAIIRVHPHPEAQLPKIGATPGQPSFLLGS